MKSSRMDKDMAEIKDLLTKHVDESNKFRSETKEALARIDVHLEYNKKEVKDLKKDIKEQDTDMKAIKADNNNLKGALAIFTVLGAAMAAWAGKVFK